MVKRNDLAVNIQLLKSLGQYGEHWLNTAPSFGHDNSVPVCVEILHRMIEQRSPWMQFTCFLWVFSVAELTSLETGHQILSVSEL